MTLREFLFENEAVNGINNPSDYLYIKILRFMLLVINSWPRKQIGEPEPSYQDAFLKFFCLAVTIAALFGSVSYVIIHISELTFLEVGHMYIVILMSAVDIFKRVEFPVSVCFAMTINKSQGQTLKCAGVDLRTNCFSHGQLYVACSRVTGPDALYILATDKYTENVVYTEVL